MNGCAAHPGHGRRKLKTVTKENVQPTMPWAKREELGKKEGSEKRLLGLSRSH